MTVPATLQCIATLITKMRFIHTLEFYSSTKEDTILQFKPDYDKKEVFY